MIINKFCLLVLDFGTLVLSHKGNCTLELGRLEKEQCILNLGCSLCSGAVITVGWRS